MVWILDRFLDLPKEIDWSSNRLAERLNEIKSLKSDISKIKRNYPETYKFMNRFKELVRELDYADDKANYWKKDIRELIGKARKKGVKIPKKKMTDLKKLMRLI